MNRLLGVPTGAAVGWFCLLAAVSHPSAWADPADQTVAVGPDISQADPASGGAVGAACQQFGAALNLAASQYEDFAYATAGGGNTVDYRSPEVVNSNVVGRTALRDAARAALSSSRADGVPPEVAEPMQAWSFHATKLLVLMGLHGGGDSLNSAASQLNTDAHNAQLACAAGGAHA